MGTMAMPAGLDYRAVNQLLQQRALGLLQGSGDAIDPTTAGLLGMAKAFAAAGAPSNVPRSGLSALSAGLTGFAEPYAAAKQAGSDSAMKGLMMLQSMRPKYSVQKIGDEQYAFVNPADPSDIRHITAPGGGKPLSDIAKLAADLKAGRITPAEYKAAIDIKMKPLIGGAETAAKKAPWERYQEGRNIINAAKKSLTTLDEMSKLLERGLDTGPLAGLTADARAIVSSLGGTVDQQRVADAQQFRNLTMDLVMKRISQTKGSISEKEMAAFERSVAGLANTPQGNKQIIAMAKNLLRKEMMWANYRNQLVASEKYSVFEIDAMSDAFRDKLADKDPLQVPSGTTVKPAKEMSNEELKRAMGG